MSWKPRQQNNKQWRKSQNHNYNDAGDEYCNYRQNKPYYSNNNNYSNRDPQSYNSYSNYGYNSNYNSNNNYNRYNNKQYEQYQNQVNNQVNKPRWINKNSKDVKYVKNTGNFQIEDIAFHELTNTLQSIWDKYYHKNEEYIEKIIFLCGPPGCGKTSVCNYVEKYYNLNKLNNNQYMIDVSNILSAVMKANNRKLIMSKAYELLFKQIFDTKNKILIIDGFLRKEQHVYVIDFLQLYMKNTSFIFLVLNVDENTSVIRQLERGKKLVKLSNSNQTNNDNEEKEGNKNKKIRLKDSDLCEYAATKRYQKYNYLLQAVRYQLRNKMKAEFDVIDATKSLQNVFQNVEIQLKKQD